MAADVTSLPAPVVDGKAKVYLSPLAATLLELAVRVRAEKVARVHQDLKNAQDAADLQTKEIDAEWLRVAKQVWAEYGAPDEAVVNVEADGGWTLTWDMPEPGPAPAAA